MYSGCSAESGLESETSRPRSRELPPGNRDPTAWILLGIESTETEESGDKASNATGMSAWLRPAPQLVWEIKLSFFLEFEEGREWAWLRTKNGSPRRGDFFS
ncbi:hypothetical protein AVEN_232335-1 [Araneus ventricosus]|uniref:Uncharacterized protein n=1 Tax=Araneus ventricosus TaxID=182803 RepID=A0A4Y2I988_ARAVE|nr:hypothetical protein AVEN_232335-1 [Araneus ventricosus]